MIGWIDAGSGASGDMLLAAVIDAGADPDRVSTAIEAVAPEAVTVTTEQVQRGSISALRAHVEVADSGTHRGLAEILRLIEDAPLADDVKRHSGDVFTRLGRAEAAVHGVSPDDVHFHEVGALDSIADIVGVCAGMVGLGLEAVRCSPIAVGSGTVATSHGQLSVPPPAVVELLRGIPSFAGPTAAEMCTPTGAALLAHWATSWGAQPPMLVDRVGTGAGGRDLTTHPNVVRILVGRSADRADLIDSTADASRGMATVLETNVDDLDPRLWPPVLQRLLDAGASDAWLTPILMKKGRPAHTLSVLVSSGRADDVRAVIFAETSAIGLRERTVAKFALDREFSHVDVHGRQIAVKVAKSGPTVVNVQPEFDDVAAAANALGWSVKSVLAAATAAAWKQWDRG
jgi:uncharacterized protein (TIGR00299 family) protein